MSEKPKTGTRAAKPRVERAVKHASGAAPLPQPADILALLHDHPEGVKRSDLARHFDLKGDQRRDLRALLDTMEQKGQVQPGSRRTVTLPVTLPHDLMLEVIAFTADYEPVAKPVEPKYKGTTAVIIAEQGAELALGDRFEASLRETEPGHFLAQAKKIIKDDGIRPVLGTFSRQGEGLPGHLLPLDPDREPKLFMIPVDQAEKLKDGALVVARPRPLVDRYSLTIADITEVVGEGAGGHESLIAISNFNIPHVWPDEVLAEAEKLPAKLTKAEIAEREDLREIPIVTIDGADAKDFDDAVWAEPWRGGGWHIIVAIADVAHYIREGSLLDQEAYTRGNSTYFPDRVVPMLPERLSNDLCSLRPNEDRPVLAVHLYIDAEGLLRKHKFVRAVIHSHARLTYDQVWEAIQGTFNPQTEALWPTTLEPLHKAFKVLLGARKRRSALDLDVPEKQVVLGPGGVIETIRRRGRNDAHMLIEEMMILANVAAAQALESKNAPCLFRVHPEPDIEKLKNLQETLKSYNLKLDKLKNIQPAHIQGLIDKIKGRNEQDMLMQLILRSQMQATYTAENAGHFGLALEEYAHFTSPIRRYSDLIVHRSLVGALKLPGKGALLADHNHVERIGEHLNVTERRSQKAEWDAVDRLTTRFYQGHLGAHFTAQVISVLKFGMFVMIHDGLAEGLIPMGLMGDDFFFFDEKQRILTGRSSKKTYRIGSKVQVTLVEANILTGQLTFAMGHVDPAEALAQSRARREQQRNRKFDRGSPRGRSDRPQSGSSDRPAPRRNSDGRGDGSYRGPRRDGENRPRREGDDRPRRDGDRPQRSGERTPYRSRDDRPRGDRPDRPQRDGERTPYRSRDDRPRGDRPDRPRREGDRPQRDGERRPYRSHDDRPRSDRPDRPRRDGDRPQQDGERRPYRSRDDKPRDDRPQRDGERKPYRSREDSPRGDRTDRPRREGSYTPRDGERKPYGRRDDKPRGARSDSRDRFGSDRPRGGKPGGKPGGRPGPKSGPRSGGDKGGFKGKKGPR